MLHWTQVCGVIGGDRFVYVRVGVHSLGYALYVT